MQKRQQGQRFENCQFCNRRILKSCMFDHQLNCHKVQDTYKQIMKKRPKQQQQQVKQAKQLEEFKQTDSQILMEEQIVQMQIEEIEKLSDNLSKCQIQSNQNPSCSKCKKQIPIHEISQLLICAKCQEQQRENQKYEAGFKEVQKLQSESDAQYARQLQKSFQRQQNFQQEFQPGFQPSNRRHSRNQNQNQNRRYLQQQQQIQIQQPPQNRIPTGDHRDIDQELLDELQEDHLENERKKKKMDENQIQRIEIQRYKKVQGSEKEECVICYNEFEENCEIKRLPCLHIFHAECLDQSLQYDSKCPICKTDLKQHFK